MQRLLTIDDLQGQWQGLLPRIELLGKWFDDLKRDETEDVKFDVFIPGERTRAPGVHASEISVCMKKLVYSLQGIERKMLPEQVNVTMKRKFGVGHVVHALTQNELARAVMRYGNGYIDFIDEVSITPDTNEFTKNFTVNSHADGLFTFFDQQFSPYIRVVLEIKTESDKEFAKLTAPRQSHIEQAHIYMRALDAPLTWFLYYNKSSSEWTPPKAPWLVTYNKKLEAQLETRILSGYRMAHDNQLPQGEEGIHCGWCSFAWACKPMYLARSAAAQQRGGPPRQINKTRRSR